MIALYSILLNKSFEDRREKSHEEGQEGINFFDFKISSHLTLNNPEEMACINHYFPAQLIQLLFAGVALPYEVGVWSDYTNYQEE